MITDHAEWYHLEEISVVNAHWMENRTTHSMRACGYQYVLHSNYNNLSCSAHCTGTGGGSVITDHTEWYHVEEISVVSAHWMENRTTHSMRACGLQCQHVLKCKSFIWKSAPGMPDGCVLVYSGAGDQINMDPLWTYWMHSE